MKKFILFVSATLFISIMIGCHHNTKVGIDETDPYLTIAGTKFRKTGGFKSGILWAGVKKDEGRNYFEPKFFPILQQDIEIFQATEAYNEQTYKFATNIAMGAGLEIVDIDFSGSHSNDSKNTGRYQIFILREVNKFIKELNSEKNRANLEFLMKCENPRIITSIATVFDREASQKIESAGNISLSIKKEDIGNPEFTIKATNTGESIAKLSDGTIFAYQYSRICWEKDEGKIKAFTIEVDNPGWDNSCPKGTEHNASKL